MHTLNRKEVVAFHRMEFAAWQRLAQAVIGLDGQQPLPNGVTETDLLYMDERERRVWASEQWKEYDGRNFLIAFSLIEALLRTDFVERNKGSNKARHQRLHEQVRAVVAKNKHIDLHRQSWRIAFTDILAAWRAGEPSTDSLMIQLKQAYQYRNWIAHGRYWNHRLKRHAPPPDWFAAEMMLDAVRQLPLCGTVTIFSSEHADAL